MIITLFILLLLSGFFSSAETALTMVNHHHIKLLVEEGNWRARIALKLISNPNKLLSTILIGNNIVNISASSLTTILASQLGGMATGIATGVLTLFILIFGEITPKSMAAINAEPLSLFYAPFIYPLSIVLTPVISVLNIFSRGVLMLLRVDSDKRQLVTERELRMIVEEGQKDGAIEKEERNMINNVFDFGDCMAREVMTPRADVISIDLSDSKQDIMDAYEEHRFTRMPVYKDDKIIGILNIKDYFYQLANLNATQDIPIEPILWNPYYVSEFQPVSSVLAELRTSSTNFAIVLDEYGEVAGIITVEDLLEEIVGELHDEYDKEEEETSIVKITDSCYELDASLRLDDVNDALGTSIVSEEYDSIGGHIIELLDHIPKEKDTVSEANLIYTVVSMDKNRISRAKITFLASPTEN